MRKTFGNYFHGFSRRWAFSNCRRSLLVLLTFFYRPTIYTPARILRYRKSYDVIKIRNQSNHEHVELAANFRWKLKLPINNNTPGSGGGNIEAAVTFLRARIRRNVF